MVLNHITDLMRDIKRTLRPFAEVLEVWNLKFYYEKIAKMLIWTNSLILWVCNLLFGYNQVRDMSNYAIDLK